MVGPFQIQSLLINQALLLNFSFKISILPYSHLIKWVLKFTKIHEPYFKSTVCNFVIFRDLQGFLENNFYGLLDFASTKKWVLNNGNCMLILCLAK